MDNNLWFSGNKANKICQISLDGIITEYEISSQSEPYGLTFDRQGNIWFTLESEAIGKLVV